jgi:hypothetical protein
MATLEDRVVLMSGGSRGIGLAIAKKVAAEGAKVAIMAKTDQPHPKLPGTIHTAAAEIEEAGGEALAILGDVRDDAQVEAAAAQAVQRFGGIDIVVNNASAINLAPMRDLAPANCLWPRTIIATAAVQNLLGGDQAMKRARTPAIYADAAAEVLRRDPRSCTGNAFIDDEVLAEAGITDLDGYAGGGADELQLDLFVDGWPA